MGVGCVKFDVPIGKVSVFKRVCLAPDSNVFSLHNV